MEHQGEITKSYIQAWLQMSGQFQSDKSAIKSSIEPDETKLFRYMTVERFLELLETRMNTLVHISMWDDPFEGFIFKGLQTDQQVMTFYKEFFGQSWTLCQDERDLYWKAYCPNRSGVRIATTVGKLKKSLKQINPETFYEQSVCCSRVKYSGETQLQTLKKYLGWDYLRNNGMAAAFSLLFYKRKEFEDECEYRIICNPFLSNRKDLVNSGMIKYPLCENSDNWGDFLEGVLVDPRMPLAEFDRFKCRVAQSAPSINVIRSTLYAWPDFAIPWKTES